MLVYFYTILYNQMTVNFEFGWLKFDNFSIIEAVMCIKGIRPWPLIMILSLLSIIIYSPKPGTHFQYCMRGT